MPLVRVLPAVMQVQTYPVSSDPRCDALASAGDPSSTPSGVKRRRRRRHEGERARRHDPSRTDAAASGTNFAPPFHAIATSTPSAVSVSSTHTASTVPSLTPPAHTGAPSSVRPSSSLNCGIPRPAPARPSSSSSGPRCPSPSPPRTAGRACGRAAPCGASGALRASRTRCPRVRAATTPAPRRDARAPC